MNSEDSHSKKVAYSVRESHHWFDYSALSGGSSGPRSDVLPDDGEVDEHHAAGRKLVEACADTMVLLQRSHELLTSGTPPVRTAVQLQLAFKLDLITPLWDHPDLPHRVDPDADWWSAVWMTEGWACSENGIRRRRL